MMWVLLQHFDTDFSDATGRHVPVVSNTTISATHTKFGASSALFNSAAFNSYLRITDNLSDLTFAGDFTVDLWFYPNDFANGANFFNSGSNDLIIYMPAIGGPGGPIDVYMNASAITGTTSLATGQWYHVALTRASGTVYLFVNGVLQGTYASSATIPCATAAWIGAHFSGGQLTGGWIDEFRIINGSAAWTANFTPPSSAYTVPGTAAVKESMFLVM
jgi:hypothetical protein